MHHLGAESWVSCVSQSLCASRPLSLSPAAVSSPHVSPSAASQFENLWQRAWINSQPRRAAQHSAATEMLQPSLCFSEGIWNVVFERCCINTARVTYWGPGTSCRFIYSTHFVMIQIKHSFQRGGPLHHFVAHLVEPFMLQNALNLTKLQHV